MTPSIGLTAVTAMHGFEVNLILKFKKLIVNKFDEILHKRKQFPLKYQTYSEISPDKRFSCQLTNSHFVCRTNFIGCC